MDGSGRGMGKQKETFEVWRKSKGKGKVGSYTKNDNVNLVTTNQKKKGSNVKDKEVDISKSKGMKNTAASTPSLQGLPAMHDHIEESRLFYGPSKEFHSTTEVNIDGRVEQLVDMTTDNGKRKRIPEHYSDTEGVIGVERTSAMPGLVKKALQRSDKEKSCSEYPEVLRHSSTFPSVEVNMHCGERDKRGRYLDSSESKENSLDSRDSRQKSSRRMNRRRRVRSHSSSSESRSPVREEGRHHQRHRSSRIQKDCRLSRSGHGRSRMPIPSESSGSEDCSPRVRKGKGYKQSRTKACHAVREGSAKGFRNRDSNHEEESSEGSAKEDRYRRDYEGKEVWNLPNSTTGLAETESQKRRGRRHREGERETERLQRERQGLKGHYIMVDYKGAPYGPGVSAWRQEVNKLSAALDPSITNIRHQPEEAMSTLRRRLKDHFEYSAPVDRAEIRKVAGKFVTQRRSRILSSMKDGDDCPEGLDFSIWKRLERLRKDPHREQLCQRMKFANASRINLGRTGPRGEEGIKMDLAKQFGREPDPQEVQMEMRRSKGYGGVSLKRRERRDCLTSTGKDENNLLEGVVEEEEVEDTESDGRGKRKRLCSLKETKVYDVSYVRRMEQELQTLRAKIGGHLNCAGGETVQDVGPSNSMPIGEQERNLTLPSETIGLAASPEKDVETWKGEENIEQQRSGRKLRKRKE